VSFKGHGLNPTNTEDSGQSHFHPIKDTFISCDPNVSAFNPVDTQQTQSSSQITKQRIKEEDNPQHSNVSAPHEGE
jgi:hypothetical protein